MVLIFRVRLASFLVGAYLALGSAHATQYWELAPTADPRVPSGTYTVVGGQTAPEGVNFTLKHNDIDRPVQLTLVSTKAGTALHFSAFKDGGSFFDKDTDSTGLMVVRFRTGDDINFKLTGPQGATYQLAVWRGPQIQLGQSPPIVPMDAAEAGGMHSPSVGMTTPGAAGGTNTLIYVLLAGILIALLAIAFLIYRGQQMRGKS